MCLLFMVCNSFSDIASYVMILGVELQNQPLFYCKLIPGDNFFKSATYTIEVLSCEPFPEEKESLRAVEAQILTKRVELSKFETEYREVNIFAQVFYCLSTADACINCKYLCLSFSHGVWTGSGTIHRDDQ